MKDMKVLTARYGASEVPIMASGEEEKLLAYTELMKVTHPEFVKLKATFHITEVPVI